MSQIRVEQFKNLAESPLVISALFAIDLSVLWPSNARIPTFHIRIFKRVFMIKETIFSGKQKILSVRSNSSESKKLLPGNEMISDFFHNRINHFLRTFRHFSNTIMRHNEFSKDDTLIW